MRTYTSTLTTLRRMAKIGTNDTTSDAILMEFFNDSVRTICNIRGGKWAFLAIQKTISTVASQRAYAIPNSIRKITSFYVTIGTQVYFPDPVFNMDEYTKLLQSQLGESDQPLNYFRLNNKINLVPVPATSSNVMTMTGFREVRDISIADYTTGGVLTATNGSTTIVGTGTTWAASMAGRFIKIANSDTANKGDGYWYEIESVTNTTTLVLVSPYEGTSISAGNAAYIIGDVTPIPEAYDMAPIYRTMALWSQFQDPVHPQTANIWWRLYDGGQEAGLSRVPGGLVGQMLENEGELIDAPYISPTGNGQIVNPNDPEQTVSTSNFT